jgi:hypothetical protein
MLVARNVYLWDVGECLSNYEGPYSRRQQSSQWEPQVSQNARWICFERLTPQISRNSLVVYWNIFFFILVCEAIGTAATPGLLCQPRVIVKMIVEKQLECRLAGETEVLGEILPQRPFCPSQNSTRPHPDFNPGRRGGNVEYLLQFCYADVPLRPIPLLYA